MRFDIKGISITIAISLILGIIGYWGYLWILKLWLWIPIPQLLFDLLSDLDRATTVRYLKFYSFLGKFAFVAIPLAIMAFLIGRYGKFIYWISLTIPIVYVSTVINYTLTLDFNKLFETSRFSEPFANFVWFELVGIVIFPLIAFIVGRRLRITNRSSSFRASRSTGRG